MSDQRSAVLRPVPVPPPAVRPLRLVVLSNRLSTRNRKGMARLEGLLSRRPQIPHVAIEDWARFPEAVARLAAADPDAIVVNGGDGTVIGLLTELRRCAPARMPAVIALAAGNTNMIAADVGSSGRPDRSLSRLLSVLDGGGELTREERRLIRVDQAGESTQYGFFVGAIAVVRATLLAHELLHPIGVHHGLAGAAAMGLGVWKVLFGGGGESALLAPVPVDVAIDSEPTHRDDYCAVIASTLDRLLFGARPFWGGGRGPIRVTLVRGPADRPLRSLLPLLRGRPTERMRRSGYLSRTVDRIELAFNGQFVIDGEFRQACPDRPIRLSDGGAVTFLRW